MSANKYKAKHALYTKPLTTKAHGRPLGGSDC